MTTCSRGFILLDTVISLGLLIVLSTSLYPLLSRCVAHVRRHHRHQLALTHAENALNHCLAGQAIPSVNHQLHAFSQTLNRLTLPLPTGQSIHVLLPN